MRSQGRWRGLRLFGRILSLLRRKIEDVRCCVVVFLANDDFDSSHRVRIHPVECHDDVVEERALDASGIKRGDRTLRLTDAGEPFDDR